jgi:hypothetical protein
MATIFASTTGSGTVTYAQAQNRTTPATLARALALHLSGDRIECELGTYGAIGSGLLGGTDSSHKTTLATVDLGASGKAKFQVADGSTPVFVPTHNNIALENLELTHGDAATRGTVGANMIETNNNVAAQNIDFLGCKLGNTRNNVIFSAYGPLPTPANQIQIDQSAPISTVNARLVSFDPPQSYLKGGSAGAAASVTTAAALVGALFKGGHAVHQTETTFNIQPTNPSDGTFSYVTWGGTTNRAWFADFNTNTFGVATSINKSRAQGSGTDITLVVFGCETWKNGKTNATLPNPSHFQKHADATVDLILTAATNNGGAAYFTHVSTWQEYKGRSNLSGPPTGWSKTGLPNVADGTTGNFGTSPYHDEAGVAPFSTTNIFSCWYVPGRKANSYASGQLHSTPVPGFTAAPHVAVTQTAGYLLAQDPRTIKSSNAFKPTGGLTSPLYAQSVDISTISMSAAQLTDARRELARDASGKARSSTAALTTVGAIEANTIAGTVTDWAPTQWDPTATFLRTRYIGPAALGTGDGSSPTNCMTIQTAFSSSNANKAIAGDDCLLLDGNHALTGTLNFHNPGTSANPIRFRAQNPGAARVFASTAFHNSLIQFSQTGGVADCRYTIIEGIEWDGASANANLGVDVQNGTHHIAIRNCFIHNTRENGIAFRQGDYFRADGNYVWECGIGSTSKPSGISINVGATNYTSDGYTGFHHYIVNNFVAGSKDASTVGSITDGNGIIIDNGAAPGQITVPATLIANNVVYHNGNRGIHVLMCIGGIFIGHNTCHENGLDTTSNAAVSGTAIGASSEFNNQGGVVTWFNNFANPWQGPGSFGSYAWEVNASYNPGTYVPDSSTAGGATTAASDGNYDQYYAWAVTKFYNVLYDTIKNHANPIVNQVKVGGPHIGFGGLNGSSGTTGFVAGGEPLHAWPMGSPDYNFTTNTGSSLPYEIDYFLLTYWLRFAHGFDFISIDYSLVEFTDTPNRTTSYIMSHYPNLGNLVRKVEYMRDNYPGLDTNTWDSAHPNTPPKRNAEIHMIEFYFDVNIGLCDSNYTESVQAMQEALVLRELWMNGAAKAYRWMPMGDVDNPSAPTKYTNTYAYFRNTSAVGIGNSTNTDVTSTGAGTKYKAYDVAKLFADNFTPGTSIYNATSSDPDLLCMASGSKLLVINTNLTTSKTFMVEGVSKTLAAKDVAVYALTGTALDDANWRFLGCDIYRGNQNNIVAHGSNWEIGNWTNAQSAVLRGQVHWWGDSTVRSGSTHGIVDYSRNMKIHDTDFHNDEAVVLDTGRAISQRASGLEVYNCIFHDCPPWKIAWYDNMHGVTRFHDNKGWNLWDVFTTFVGASDVAPNLYTWTAGQNAVDDITIAKNTFHFADTTTNTTGAGNVFDFTDASAAYIGNLEIADNVITGNFSKGWDFGTRTAAFLTNQGNLGTATLLTNTFHAHNNIYRITGGTGVQFRHQNTTRSLASTQSAGTLSGFTQETSTLDIDPNLGLAPGSSSTLVSGTFGAPDFYPQSPTGPTVDTGTNTLDDLGLTNASGASSGHFRALGSATDVGFAEFVSLTVPAWVQGVSGATTSATATTVTTAALTAPPTPGNLLTLAVYFQAAGTFTTPTGWNLVLNPQDTSSVRTFVYQKIATSSEPSSITITVPNASSIVVLYDEWSGVSSSSPIDTVADGSSASTGTAVTAVAITGGANPTQANDLAVAFVGWQSSAGLTLGTGSTGTTWQFREGPVASTGAAGANAASLTAAINQGSLSTGAAASFAGTLATARRWAGAIVLLKAAVLISPPSNTVLPVITPSTGIIVGTVLTVSNGTWANSPTSFAYQWTRNGTNIAGATTSTYTIQAIDAGTNIAATVTATNSIGSTPAAANAVTVGGVPANSVAPGISGATSQGSTLTATTGTWTNSPTSFSYQWRRDGTNITGAVSSTYSLAGLDLGHSITAIVTATNSFGSNNATSNSIAIPSSAYGQGPAVIGLELLEWPSTLPVAIVPTTAWSDFVPVLYPISPEGIPTFLAAQMRTYFAASPPVGSQASMAIYSYGYTGLSSFSATLVGSTAAFAATGTSPKLVDLTGAPLGLDFTQNRYFVGIMTQSAPKVLHSIPGSSLYSVIQFATARSSLTDWPATFDQTAAVPYANGWPYLAIGTATSTWFI